MAFQAINLSIAQSGRDLSGKYEKGKRIGRGASSDVWYGRLHTDTGDVEIAVKELQVQHYSMQDSSSSQHEYLMKRCLKEVLTVENVKHPNIVPLLGYSIDSLGVPVLITPWYSYGNVIKYLEAQPSANRLALALDAAEGLKYLHSIGLIHGDIHGENLLVDSSGRASLCDLGISQFIEDAILVTGLTTAHANAGGTDRFSSPEILKDQPKTLATDIWAFGCLVAQILTGRIPYGKIVRKYAIHAAINKGELPMENQDGKIGGILWECLKRCWNHEPNFRPMVSEICSHLAGEGLSSTTAQGIEDMGSPHRDDMARLDLSGKVDFGERCNRSGYSDIWRGKLRTNTGVVEVFVFTCD
ncbi:hypothetical protein FRC02_000247 [Tulasnella sp. 418]|nr:hypothetical protein FRC02_000247 [Tulasnella sp. 418]